MRYSSFALSAALASTAIASPVILDQDHAQAVFGLDTEVSSFDAHDIGSAYARPEVPSTDGQELGAWLEGKHFADVDPLDLELAIGLLEDDLSVEQELESLVELEDGSREWISDSTKWALRREGIAFMDVTDEVARPFAPLTTEATVKYPNSTAHNESLAPLLATLNSSHMHAHLEKFTSFHTRYYKSDYGRQSSEWLLGQVTKLIKSSGASEHGATVKHFKHPWGQNSVIATLPGQSNSTVVVGAHQDSINLFFPSLLAAPGADDDGSGTVTILEALRVLLQDRDIIEGKASNTLEFHWYSAEEGGLLGSQAIFKDYARKGRNVKAMLQQDMTGYVQKTLDAGKPESVGVITDFVDPGLTNFIEMIVTDYCTIPYTLTKCGYACSDHASASKAGYPSAFVIESDFEYSDKKIHTTEDKIEFLSFSHMLQHARLTLAFAYELAFADFKS